ncbi:MAG: 3-oxoacyl-[acyl-carrier-protein] reductase [Bacteroidales bacterium]|nr:3-oxoacyl-[acyl-carrier-protein] reductase [Clostridium sp.]MCM1202698.1 3-oxoacyl-[acyl-carrier-protein] reductase [Bacteroidales bacterium]
MLTGKIALVTGASRGIGKQTAITLASYGATVIVNYNGSEEKANEVVAAIKESGGMAAAYGCNVSDYGAVESMMDSLFKEYGRIDILVNNAGVTKDGLLMKMSEADYDTVLDINLKGTFNCIRHISRRMLKQKSGRIINLSSVVGVYGNAGQVNYSASKAGIIGITKSAAKELGSRGITVNAVAPGFIITEMTDAMPEEAKKQVADRIAMKRLGEVTDIAETVAFLASDKAAYITGQVLCVDGGMSI